MENLARHISDLHVVDRQRSILTDLRSTKNPKLYYLFSLATGMSFKRQKISETELFNSRYRCSKQLVYQINIRKCKLKKTTETGI